MRRNQRKRHDSEMLITHKAPAAEMVNEDEAAPTREAAEGLARLRAMAAATTDAAEREALVDEIQERFGNEAARETIARLRAGTEGEA